MTFILRTTAVLIAVAGLVDPALTLAGRARARVAVLVQDAPTMELPTGAPRRTAPRDAGAATRRAVAERVRAQLTRSLADDFDVPGDTFLVREIARLRRKPVLAIATKTDLVSPNLLAEFGA